MRSVWRCRGAGMAALALVLAAGPARGETIAGPIVVTPTFDAAGVRLGVTGDEDGDATAALFYRPAGDAGWREALPLARLDAGRFAGSLFGLAPGALYEARVVLTDPEDPAPTEATTTFHTRAEEAEVPAARTWHVAPDGRDGGRGGPSAPLRTIQHAVDRAQPGDLILVRPGVYHEAVTVRRSGTPTQPIRIRAAGPGVILDGAERRLARVDARRQWRRVGDGFYSAALPERPGYVAADGARLYAFDTLEALRAGAEGGGWHYDIALRRLFLKLPDGADPDTVPIQAARLPHAFLLDGARHVVVEGFTIRFYGVNAFGKGILLLDASQCVLRANRIENVNRGIWVKGAARENLVEANSLAETSVAAWPPERVRGTDAEGAAITLTAGPGNVVRGNRVEGFWDGILVSSWGDLANEGYVIDLDVSENEVRGVGNRGIAVEGAGVNARIRGNIVDAAAVGIALSPVVVGPCAVLRNRVSEVREIGIAVAGSAGLCYLLHNSVASSVPGARGIATAGPWLRLVSRNNAVRVAGSPLDVAFDPPAVFLDFDALFSEGEAPLVHWDTGAFAALLDFTAATGQEPNGLAADPAFVDPAAGDLRLLPESPLRDRGALLPNINDDAPDGLPDIGAVEG